VLRQAAYAILGVVAGVLVNFVGSWTESTGHDSYEILGAKPMVTRNLFPSTQSIIFSVIAVLVPALICACTVAVITRKKFT
jgi:hypothetical protein